MDRGAADAARQDPRRGAALADGIRRPVRRIQGASPPLALRHPTGAHGIPGRFGPHGFGEGVNKLTAKYLNRLSDLLFVLARYENRGEGDQLWVPGKNR